MPVSKQLTRVNESLKEKTENEAEKIFEEIVTNSFSDLVKNIN